MRNLPFILILLFVTTLLPAQNTLVWTKDFNTNATYSLSAFQPSLQIIDDTIRVAGVSCLTGPKRVQLVDYSLAGDTIRTCLYSSDTITDNSLFGYDYAFDSLHNLYVMREVYLEYYKSKIEITKYSSDNSLLWTHEIMSVNDTSFNPISFGLINDTSFFVFSYVETEYPVDEYDDHTNPKRIASVFAFNSNGKKLWERRLDPQTELDYIGYEMISPGNNEAILLGHDSDWKEKMLRINIERTVNDFDDVDIDYGVGNVLQDGDHLYITSSTNYHIYKYSLSGELVWEADYGTNLPYNVLSDKIEAIIADDDGNIFVSGRHQGKAYNTDADTRSDILTLKYNPEGNIIWKNRYVSSGYKYESGKQLIIKNNFVYVGGYVQGRGSRMDSDYIVLKLDLHSGENLGTYIYNGGNSENLTSMDVFEDGRVAITGMIGAEYYDWRTQLISDVIIQYTETNHSDQTTIYPNPVRENGVLSIENDDYQHVSVISLDGTTHYNGQLSPQLTNQITLKNYKPGIYLITLSNKQTTQTKKIIIH